MGMVVWKLQEAKNRLSEVVDRAVREGPQTITRRGEEIAVLLSVKDYRRLRKPKQSFVEFMRNSPLAEAMREGELDFSRSKDPGREIDLL